jgi:hypothetical protein
MNLILFSFLISLSTFAAEVPVKDNILFAFEKCKSLSVDLNTGLLKENNEKAFDIHCKMKSSDEMEFTCDFFDPGSDQKQSVELLRGGKDKNNVGTLRNAYGTFLRLYFEKSSAQYETSIISDDGRSYGKKVCSGIYILEKEALKKKTKS